MSMVGADGQPVFFVMAVVFYVLNNNEHLSYEVVEVNVISAHSANPLSKTDSDRVVVEYNGKNYEVENLRTSQLPTT